MIRTDYQKNNPLVAYLDHEGIAPGDFAIMARVDNVDVYEVTRGRYHVLPKSFVQAIDERSGEGTGAKIASAYVDYRAYVDDGKGIEMRKVRLPDVLCRGLPLRAKHEVSGPYFFLIHLCVGFSILQPPLWRL